MPGYDAFISYSRRASTHLATDLQVGVERFAKPWYRLRAVRVFRDDASMSANTALWSTIERGLSEAEWLVLLASPAGLAVAVRRQARSAGGVSTRSPTASSSCSRTASTSSGTA